MILDDEAIKEYRQLYKAHYGKEVSEDEAADQARRVLAVVKFALTDDQYKNLDKINIKYQSDEKSK